MDAAAAALEELLSTGDDTSSGVGRTAASMLGWHSHSSVMGPLRATHDAGSRFRGGGGAGGPATDHDLTMNSSSSLPADDVTSTTPPPTTNSCLAPQLSPNNRSGINNANGAGHPTNSIRESTTFRDKPSRPRSRRRHSGHAPNSISTHLSNLCFLPQVPSPHVYSNTQRIYDYEARFTNIVILLHHFIPVTCECLEFAETAVAVTTKCGAATTTTLLLPATLSGVFM
ncbi:hypothetical protein U1Q18_046059 [Sarracenia purpurea var. burkii]